MAQIGDVIDAGFSVGLINHRNVDLIKISLETGKRVISVRSYAESQGIFGKMADKILYCRGFSELMAALERERKDKI